MGPRSWMVVAPAVVAAIAAPIAGGGGAGTAATLPLNGVLQIESRRDTPCPPGTGAGLLCPARTGAGVVRGIGRVTETYTYLVEETPPACGLGSARVFGYPVRWVVQGKGELHFAVAEVPGCISNTVAFTVAQSFTVTGGTGIYAGATGSGRVDRRLAQVDFGARGPETWSGTITVPGLEFDVIPPVISGATPRTVRVPRRATRATVRYAVTALDAVDGRVAVSCSPPSGRKFRVGRTLVRCTAVDSSGNTATAAFRVTVRRR